MTPMALEQPDLEVGAPVEIRVPGARFIESLYPWHYETLRVFDEGRARFIMAEIHRRARKTTFGLNLLVRECATHPKRPYFYMGPTYKQAKKTVWLDPNMLFAALPDRQIYPWEKNESELYIRFPNGAILQILGGDDPDSLRGPDWEGGVLDEWALMKEEIFTEILRPVMTQDIRRWVLFLYTTKGFNHAAQMFNLYGGLAAVPNPVGLPASGATAKPKAGWYCTRLDAEVSGILPRAELGKAKAEMPRWFYDQEMRCARITAEERALITSVLMASLDLVYISPLETRKLIACDPSEGRHPAEKGVKPVGDEIVVQYFENNCVKEQRVFSQAAISDNIMILSGHLKNMAMEFKCNNFIVDGVGIGKGVADDLSLNEKYEVQIFKGGEKSSEPERFADKNMEAVWCTSRQMRTGKVDPIEDAETRRQLTKLRCQANRRGQLQLDPSPQIKKDCGCSPDRARCYVMGTYGLQFVEPEPEPEKTRYRDDEDEMKPELA